MQGQRGPDRSRSAAAFPAELVWSTCLAIELHIGKFHAMDEFSILHPVLSRRRVYPLNPYGPRVALHQLAVDVLNADVSAEALKVNNKDGRHGMTSPDALKPLALDQ